MNITNPTDPIITLTPEEDARTQQAMMLVHRYYLGIELDRPPTDLEAAQSWVSSGLAKLYRDHYKRG